MLQIRLFEESLVEPILRGEIKTPCHLYTGQEAIAVGVCAALSPKDYAFGYHRSHGHYLAKGGDMKALAAEIYGKETGCSRGRGGSMHVIAKDQGFLGSTPMVAETVALALGAALSCWIRRQNRVAVSFFGDGAIGEGVIYESLNFAALKKLPILFVCENNFYSTHLPLSEIRPKDNISEIGRPFGVPSFRADGNDVLKVFETAQRAVKRCKAGKGPVFLEFRTYRLRGHVGPDDNIQGLHTDIRPKRELERWKKKDPIKRFENRLLRQGIGTKSELQAIWSDGEKEVKEAHRFAEKSPFPSKKDVLKYVFS